MMKSVHLSLLSLLILLIFEIHSSYAQKTLTEEFTLETSDGIQLAGQIDYPNKSGRFPSAILIWGNGPHTRDMEISGSPIFKQIADSLLKLDMVVLRMDKRGFGKSKGDISKSEGNYTTHDLVNDFKLAYNYLNHHHAVDTGNVGLIGHSEGSIIAPILATEVSGVDWIITFGSVGVSGADITRAQNRLNRKRLGISEEISEAIEIVWEDYITMIKDGTVKNDSIYYDLGTRFLVAHGLNKDDKRITYKFIDQLLDEYRGKWYQYFYNTNVTDFIRKIEKPYLVVFGENDIQTSVELNLIPINQALSEAGNKHYKIVVLSDEDHFFLRSNNKRMEKHEFGKMKISDRLMTTIRNWLLFEGICKVYQ
ncbi:hypothetical protein SAMN04488029_0950 [Reichenbachiella faecimaris]|uniref:Serine aminopeptidase S33 domain-containing protein n=1 Tax=Reichenbachiella faecimaris TaxID=692418 RepID=A0A1W2G7M5_REIFA|nr:alpha/beta hydrolase [Reichenbachiella faecimaris]SMD32601.1 hypothetical protein SAMN04488029_0950 [Reichenbachiella faecimaris]